MRTVMAVLLGLIMGTPLTSFAQNDARTVIETLMAGDRVAIVLDNGGRLTATLVEAEELDLLVTSVDAGGKGIRIPGGKGPTRPGDVRVSRASIVSVERIRARTTGDTRRFDPATFGIGDRLKVTTDRVHTGTVLGVNSQEVTLKTADGPLIIPVEQITKIRRRTNGVTLGAAIGAGAGVVAALPIIAWFSNEGADATGFAALFVASGSAAGMLVDGMIGRYRTVYERAPR